MSDNPDKEKNTESIENSGDLDIDSKKETMQKILKFCPICGIPIKWSKDLRYCINCGSYLIPYIPKSSVKQWLDVNLSDREIELLYSPRFTAYHPRNENILHQYQTGSKWYRRGLWGWKASLGVPILSYFGKLIAVLALSFIVLFIIAGSEGVGNIGSLLTTPQNMVILAIVDLSTQPIFILIPYWIIGYYLPRGATSREKWNALGIPIGKIAKKRAIKDILIGISFAVIMTVVVIIAEYGSAYFTSFIYNIPINDLVNQDTTGSTISEFPATLGFFFVFAAFMFFSIGPSEEILFRGFAQQGFTRSWGKKAGWIITAVYFTIFHIYTYITSPPLFMFTFIPYLAISLILGALYMWRKNVISTIFAHATYDSLQFLLFLFLFFIH